jgi:hypothetical protein
MLPLVPQPQVRGKAVQQQCAACSGRIIRGVAMQYSSTMLPLVLQPQVGGKAV